MSRKPVEIEAQDDEQLVERVAAIDVAKASGEVCTRVPHASIPGQARHQGLEHRSDDERALRRAAG